MTERNKFAACVLLLPRSMLQSVPVAQSSVDLALIVIDHHMPRLYLPSYMNLLLSVAETYVDVNRPGCYSALVSTSHQMLQSSR